MGLHPSIDAVRASHKLTTTEVNHLSHRFPFFRCVPRDLEGNLEFRAALIERCAEDEELRRDVWIACRRDLLFYISTFVWTHDPRPDGEGGAGLEVLPFVPYPFQIRALAKMSARLGYGDMGIAKSRDLGATWLILVLLEHRWKFWDNQAFAVLSRTEEEVDKTNEPGCLFYKLDFIQKYQPAWMVPEIERTRLMLANKANGSVISGASTTSNALVSRRYTAVMLDEFALVPDGTGMLAATQAVTNSRIFNSTPRGTANAFYRVMHEFPGVETVKMLWYEHPKKVDGLYADENDDGKIRSSWYDHECERSEPRLIAQELDCDFGASDYRFFNETLVKRHAGKTERPFWRGKLTFKAHTLNGRMESIEDVQFEPDSDGPLRIWLEDYPPKGGYKGSYGLGCDIAGGQGAASSVGSVVDLATGRKVAEWESAFERPTPFAAHMVALARLFDDAWLIWDAQGPPGQTFGNTVIDVGYNHLWIQPVKETLRRTVGDKPGYALTKPAKAKLMEHYREQLERDAFTNPSEEAVAELRHYIEPVSGTVEHSAALRSDNPNEAGSNHGDRVVADALAAWLLSEAGPPQAEEERAAPAIGTSEWVARMREIRGYEDERASVSW